ncbi:hypothetical protein OIU77_017508 [Salix suchowensis]|uniref:3-deoxy-D-manno-octulosonic-acid transferase N-terminal domain-containing protein n=1 Tax=Salix suchowensis TaxID=1278906 RepID=A0ABQ8ZP32_9ROSI|nr:hypothetical protein OIU77_017508 [Salix suchowensis]KAJ6316239.1 hypothetical protein OIU78_019506 [Salix suchowensis]
MGREFWAVEPFYRKYMMGLFIVVSVSKIVAAGAEAKLKSFCGRGMGGVARKGMLVYEIYRALSYVVSPLLQLHLRWRKIRGLEHPTRLPERLGRPSLTRPPGPLLWFHAVSLGEGMAAIPVIKECVKWRPDLNILLTTATIEVIINQLPTGVLHQFSPIDTPAAMDAFLDYWNPNAIMLLECELWPNLIMVSSRKGIQLALLNARVSMKSFKLWSAPVLFPLISLLLSKFSLIIPLSSMQGIHFQLLQAPPFIINFAGDLKYAVEYDASKEELRSIDDLKVQLGHRKVWMASSIHRGEEEVMLGVHKVLKQVYPDLVTIIVPRYPQHGKDIAQKLQKEGQLVALRSQHQKIVPGRNIYVVDTLGELRHLYRLTPVAVIGGSFFPGLAGHNISEAAAAGCAVLTGYHVGHFSHMIREMQRLNPLSVLQVTGKLELEEAMLKFFSDAKVLEARQTASKQAFHALSNGIIANAWNVLYFHVLKQALLKGR